MSSPRGIGVSREGTRVILKEITATLHNSPPLHPSRQKSGNDNLTAEHEVKVRFAREFADVGLATENLCSVQESLSSASSFHSLSSTLSTKSSSGICPDSTSDHSDDIADTSYVNRNISGVEDLILACADIHLGSEGDTQNLSQDQTFASATDGTSFHASNCSLDEDVIDDDIGDETRVIKTNSQLEEACVSLDQTHTLESFVDAVPTQNSRSATPLAEAVAPQIEESVEKHIPLEESDNTVNKFETACNITCSIVKDSLPTNDVDNDQLNVTATISSDSSLFNVVALNEEQAVEDSYSAETPAVENSELCPVEVSVPSAFSPVKYTDSSLPTISSILLEESKVKESGVHDLLEPTQEDASSTSALSSFNDIDQQSLLSQGTVNSSVVQDTTETKEIIGGDSSQPCIALDSKEDNTRLLNKTNIVEPKVLKVRENVQTSVDKTDSELKNNILNETHGFLSEKENVICNETRVIERNLPESIKENLVESANPLNTIKEDAFVEEDLDRTLTLQEVDINLPDEEQYEEFKPQRQSTTLSLIEKETDFEEFKSTAQQLTNELLNPKLELADETEETEQFVTATAEIFRDPSTFDFLLARSDSNRINRLRAESLYIKFDPLVSNSMLPQGNAQSVNEEQNGKSESPVPDVGTPKRNPAIAAIDRLLFYSPLPSGTNKIEEAQEKNEQPVEEPKSDAPLIADHVDMSKELELVRTTVLQLEEELEKQKKEHKAEVERQKTAFQEKINKLQAQMAQEVKTKSQMTVVVEEYEKSISRLLTEREKDRTNFEQEKAKLQEELQAANHHLTNTEAAFNDVHQKYERLKGVVSAYKNNESVLKESIQENVDTIKTLETRYDQLKEHAMTQLEKANLELDGIRKQNEAETVKLHAMIRKAELKSNSLAELVEQKTKENKELAKILDEVIARVAPGNSE